MITIETVGLQHVQRDTATSSTCTYSYIQRKYYMIVYLPDRTMYMVVQSILINSGALAARRAAKRSPILIMQGKDKGNP